MNETLDVALYDLSPTLRLMILGILVALGPLAWVWLRNKQRPPAQRLAAHSPTRGFLRSQGARDRVTYPERSLRDYDVCER